MMAKGIDVCHAIPGVVSAAANTGWQRAKGPQGTFGVLGREMPSPFVLRECEESRLAPSKVIRRSCTVVPYGILWWRLIVSIQHRDAEISGISEKRWMSFARLRVLH
jgi:hypothetical protein